MRLASPASLQPFLNRLALRSILTDEEVGAIAGLPGQIVQHASRADFVRLGTEVSHASLVVEGLVGRFGITRQGARQISGLYIPGDMADLSSMVIPNTGWGLTALTNTTTLRVPHAALRGVVARHPAIAEAFWRDCVADSSILSEWVMNLGRRYALARIAHLLCEMAIRCELAGLGSRRAFPLPIRQGALSDATGLTGIHVNRTLMALKARAGVTTQLGMVNIPDWDQIVSIGDFDDAFLLLENPSSIRTAHGQ